MAAVPALTRPQMGASPARMRDKEVKKAVRIVRREHGGVGGREGRCERKVRRNAAPEAEQ